jgi:hypothetical protein
MIKDPLHNEDTPYEMLGLDPNACNEEVHKSLPRFMRDKKNIPNLGKAQEAIKRLKNPKDRMAIDILYYCIGEVDKEDTEELDIDLRLRELCVVPYLNNDELYSDLIKGELSDNFGEILVNPEISLSKVKIKDLPEYDDFKNWRPKLEFDR